MLKTLGYLAAATLLLSSCAAEHRTSSTVRTQADTRAASVASLRVGERVTAEMEVPKSIRKGGWDNVRQAVEAKALEKAGNADVLLNPAYVVEKHRRKITRVAVSGRPAYYTDFHRLPDSVWTNPVFRAGFENAVNAPKLATGTEAIQALAKQSANPREQKYSPRAQKSSKSVDPNEEGLPFRMRVRKKGFSFMAHVGVGYVHTEAKFLDRSAGGSGESYGEDGYSLPVDFGLGGQFTPHFYAGIGASFILNPNTRLYEGADKFFSSPLYAEARYYFQKRNTSSFVHFRLGTCFPKDKCDMKIFPYAAGGFGYSVGHFDIVVMYQFEKFKDKWDYEAYSFNRHHFSLNLGYHF